MAENPDYETDVLIFGGGPAGASAALTLLNYSNLRATIIEQSALDKMRVGEQVSASIFEMIDYLKINRDEFGADCFTPSYGGVTYWGSDLPSSRDSIFAAEGPSYQLDREKFDLKLLQVISDRGGQIFPRTKGLVFEKFGNNNHWKIQLKHPEQGSFTINSRYLIDATGRQASICHRAGALTKKLDKLTGVGGFFNFPGQRSLANDQLIEATELGWWYSALLPNQTLVVTFFTDADIVSKYQLNQRDHWLQLLRKTSHMKVRLSGAQSNLNKLVVRSAASQISNSNDVRNFVAIGDAACSFDPISSMGLGFAMTSASRAAIALMNDLPNAAITNYHQDIVGNFESYLPIRKHFYQREQRWPKSEFWGRRH